MPHDEIIRALYCLPPGEFESHRDRALSEAQRDGKHEHVLVLSTLRRPSSGAWLVNRLVAEQPEDVAQLAARLAAVEAAGEDQQAREKALDEYYAAVARLVEAARMLAYRARTPLDPAVSREVTASLLAPLDDAAALDVIAAGLVTGSLGRPHSPHPAAARRRMWAALGAPERQRHGADGDVPLATVSVVIDAPACADAAEEALRTATAQHARATAGVMDASAAVEHAEETLRAARDRLRTARRAVLATQRELSEARAHAEAARRRAARRSWARSG